MRGQCSPIIGQSETPLPATTSICLSGELDIARAPELREAFVSDGVFDALSIQVDLTRVTFLDSSCIGVLVSACKATRSRGGSFSLRCNNGVRRVLEVMGLLDYFEVSDPE